MYLRSLYLIICPDKIVETTNHKSEWTVSYPDSNQLCSGYERGCWILHNWFDNSCLSTKPLVNSCVRYIIKFLTILLTFWRPQIGMHLLWLHTHAVPSCLCCCMGCFINICTEVFGYWFGGDVPSIKVVKCLSLSNWEGCVLRSSVANLWHCYIQHSIILNQSRETSDSSDVQRDPFCTGAVTFLCYNIWTDCRAYTTSVAFPWMVKLPEHEDVHWPPVVLRLTMCGNLRASALCIVSFVELDQVGSFALCGVSFNLLRFVEVFARLGCCMA